MARWGVAAGALAALCAASAPAAASAVLGTRDLVAGGLAVLGAGALGSYTDSAIRFEPGEAGGDVALAFGDWAFHYNDDVQRSVFNAEWRGRARLGPIRPAAGGFVTAEGSSYGYTGIQIDVYAGEHVILSPSTAAGLYAAGGGEGVELNHVVEFRSGMTAAYRLGGGARLGLGLHHLSNAGLGKPNPGADTWSLRLTVPLGAGA